MKVRPLRIIAYTALSLLMATCEQQPLGMVSRPAAAPTIAAPLPIASPVPTPSDAGDAGIARILQLTWQGYKVDYIQGDGRIVDHQRAGVSTSEGQSYALLRAVWSDDQPTFVSVWAWTRHNLQVRPDHLFGYLWGHHDDGKWSILDQSSATDGDEDIALALVFAARRWRDDTYLHQARAIMGDIWRHEVAVVGATPYVTAGSWAPSYSAPGPALNPSYLAPYAYRIFAQIDRAHPWIRLVDSSYSILTECSAAPLGDRTSVGLPPNWCALQRSTGRMAALPTINRADDFGYDAFRALWRVSLDYLWNGEPRARAYLAGIDFLRRQWHRVGMLGAYSHAGTPIGLPDDPVFYAGALGNFVVADPAAAQAIVSRKLIPLLRHQAGVAYWDQRYSYYEQNWIWFGLALAADKLPNLTASSPSPSPVNSASWLRKSEAESGGVG